MPHKGRPGNVYLAANTHEDKQHRQDKEGYDAAPQLGDSELRDDPVKRHHDASRALSGHDGLRVPGWEHAGEPIVAGLLHPAPYPYG